MEEISRRLFMSMTGLANATLMLSGCALTGTPQQQAVALKQFQEYADVASDAAIAAIQAAEADPKYSTVVAVLGPYVQQLHELRQQVDSLTVADLNARAIAQHVLKALQQVAATTQVVALLGPAAVAFTLALTIIANFADDLPPPAGAPARPPPALHQRTMALRARLNRTPR